MVNESQGIHKNLNTAFEVPTLKTPANPNQSAIRG